MHDSSVTPAATLARQGNARALAPALQGSRADTLATFAAFERALPGLAVPLRAEVNPPLWELGHIGWFQEFWLARNPVHGQGAAADPEQPRGSSWRPDADALYDSSKVPHDVRWALPLPDADGTRADLAQQLAGTLTLLHEVGVQADDGRDAALYFFRLALLHEDMHHEAALYTAQALGWPVGDARWQPRPLPDPQPALAFAPGPWGLGQPQPGFQFDNERGPHTVTLPAVQIDTQVLRWADYLPFVEAGAGPVPRYLRRAGTGWQVWRWGRWLALDRALPACHLTWHEANAWCAWAGRRLPTEAEWERAAITRPDAFDWGAVWEWTASPFAAFPAFEPHPYRDYSAPWFGGSHRVLRGASFLTQPRMHHPRYRNFFMPDRSDIAVGFRSCSL